jgi:CDP-glucose 4,6-dehydratase
MINYKKFFKNKKILITGNTGFVGSYLSLIFSLMGSKILGFSLKKKNKGYLSNQINYQKNIQTINSDITKIGKYYKDLNKFKPQIVIHLAAQPIVKDSYIDAKNTYKTNILGTVELLEVIKKIPSIKNIVIFTSDKVYQNLDGKYLNENSKLGGIDPYSASKSTQDIIANSYKESFFKNNKNITIIRAGNIIGGGDFDYTRIIPELFLSAHKNKTLVLRNPYAIRPWQHILDVSNAIMFILFKHYSKIKSKSIIYNVGPDNKSNITVLNLILKINKKNFKLKLKKKNKIKFNETKILKLSNKLIKKKIKWKPILNITDTVNLTVDWYRNFYNDPKNIYKFSIKQIKKFFKILN